MARHSDLIESQHYLQSLVQRVRDVHDLRFRAALVVWHIYMILKIMPCLKIEIKPKLDGDRDMQSPVKQAKESGSGRTSHTSTRVVQDIIQKHKIPIAEKFIAFESVLLAKECLNPESKHSLRGTMFIFTSTIIFRSKSRKFRFACSAPDMVLSITGIKHVRASKATLSLHLLSDDLSKLGLKQENPSNRARFM